MKSPNDTKVNVTFQLLSVSEPVPAYNVIQSMLRADFTLEEVLGYEVLASSTIVYHHTTHFTT